MRRAAVVTGICLLGLALAPAALAQSSLGIGTSDAITPSPGFLGGVMQWVNAHQQQFYRAVTGALKGMREDGAQIWLLVGLSFAYGVFHAAGPGHGKAVISSYMLANEVALRRGVLLSFVSAFLQAVSALVVVGLAFLVLRRAGVSMTSATWSMEVASFALVAAFGAWLLWKKAAPRLKSLIGRNPAATLSASATPAVAAPAWGGEACAHVRLKYRAPAARGDGGVADELFCDTCGRSHAPDPALLAGKEFDWRSAWSAVLAVGLRPCSGAIIVLSFAFLNSLWLGGVLSVLAMSLGTAITVSALAILAVTAKNWAVGLAGGGRTGNAVHAAIEIGGALMVLLLGLVMLAASLSA